MGSENKLYKIEELPVTYSPEKWNEYILSGYDEHITYGIAHNPSVSLILAEYLNGEAKSFHFIDKQNGTRGLLQAVIVKGKFFSIPVFPISGIYCHSEVNKNELYDELLNTIIHYEIRDFIQISRFTLKSKVLCYLKLQNYQQAQLEFFKAKLRNQINRGLSFNFDVIIGGDELLDRFYALYSKNMHRIGSPVIERRFFEILLEKYKYGIKQVFLIRYNGYDVGGSVVLTYGKLYEVGWASTDHKYNNLKTNMVLYWEMIKHAIELNMSVFSFGRATINSGSYQFKKQWNGEFIPIYFNYDSRKIDLRKAWFLQKTWRFLPSFLTDRIGPIIRKKIE